MRRPGEEHGFAIVIVLVLLTIILALGAAALAESLASRSSANRDARSRRAVQAADFGVQSVLYRQNQLNIDALNLSGGLGVLGSLDDCVVPTLNPSLMVTATTNVTISGTGVATSGSTEATLNACPVATGPGSSGANGGSTPVPVGDHDFYTAEFAPGETVASGGSGVSLGAPKIISIGIDDNGSASDPNRYVYARVVANLAPVDPFRTVEAGRDLTFDVTGVTAFNGTARAGRNVSFTGTPLGAFAGTNVLGPGNSVIGPTAIDYGCAGGYSHPPMLVPVVLGGINQAGGGSCTTPFFTRPPVSVAASKVDCSISCPPSGYIGGAQDEIYSSNPLSTVTLTPGNDYVFCSFNTNGPVTLPSGTTNTSLPVRIFIDSPTSSRCSGFVAHNGVGAGSFTATQGVGGLVGGGANVLSPSQIQIYVVGNGTNNGTTFTSNSPAANAFFLYAPQSNVSVSTSAFSGTTIGYDVAISALTYTQDVGLDNYPLSSTVGVFHVTGYQQCSVNDASGNAVQTLTTVVSTDTSGC